MEPLTNLINSALNGNMPASLELLFGVILIIVFYRVVGALLFAILAVIGRVFGFVFGR